MKPQLFTRALELALCAGLLATLAGCPPGNPIRAEHRPQAGDGSDGVYYAAANKLFNQEIAFDIRWKVTHEPPAKDAIDPSINIDNRQLTLNRCTRCHECGFEFMFDLKNYESANWAPKYKGTDWDGPIARMQGKSNAFLNPEISQRIYTFLRDETTIGYDLENDNKGAVVVELDSEGKRRSREDVPQN